MTARRLTTFLADLAVALSGAVLIVIAGGLVVFALWMVTP